MFPCRCQRSDYPSASLERLQSYSNLGPLVNKRLETTQAAGRLSGPEGQSLFREAFEAATRYAQQPRGWMVLTGPSGSGKTHLAAAIANRCISDGLAVFFMNVADFLDHLRATYAPDTAISYDDLFQQVREAPLLVLDDLGAHSTTAWAQEKLLQVLSHRYNSALPTIITVRVPLKQLDEGLSTRLQDPELSQVYSLGPGSASLLQQFGGFEEHLLNQMTFEKFEVGGNNADKKQRTTLEAALKAAQGYARDPHGWLLLGGPHGCGKTHLAAAIANERLKNAQPVFFAFVPDLLDHLRAAFGPDSRVGYDERFEQIKTAPLLVLDDLGSESNTPWAEEKLYQVVVHRHNARLPTVITATDDRFAPAIASRLGDIRIVQAMEIEAPDWRIQTPTPPSRSQEPRTSYQRQTKR